MGLYVHWQVSWSNGKLEELGPLAKDYLEKHREEMREIDGCSSGCDAAWVLEKVVEGKGYFVGPKGDMWCIGRVGNYSHGKDIMRALAPFFLEMYRREHLFDFERAICFCERESREEVEATQVRLKQENVAAGEMEVVIEDFTLPEGLFWGQN